MKRFVDEVDGVSEYISYDDAAETFSVERVVDLQSVVDDVAAKQTQTLGKTEFGWHIGSLHPVLLMKYAKARGIANFWDLLKPEYASEIVRLCQDSDYRKFSPTEGKA